eukprot:CAMPEP_0181226190 /NCGR_PEP_ID=MMETSP1096-20121128/32123_1 /TAXON_ID=156174 ORGANISM="Chrysochromulina ericina, Strain CCMP281" /NCGR_SAMPLE_ID=MMETSP1096 /ASSEMBLY_ACC=CAM_ASM_000453 /LENGTH=40 /DNA_ID= /DNA_START= /DNA_END= /DNA_ORIENTATION=
MTSGADGILDYKDAEGLRAEWRLFKRLARGGERGLGGERG